jgi:hypothetical protein
MHTALVTLTQELIHFIIDEGLDSARLGMQLGGIDHDQVFRLFNLGSQGKTQCSAIYEVDLGKVRVMIL